MKKHGIFKHLFFCILIGVMCVLSLPSILNSLKFGLDLQGGFEVLYQVSSLNGEELTNDMLTNTYKTLIKRIDSLGVSEPEITIEGDDKIRVQLAGVTSPDEARNTLGKVATLTFRDSSDNLLMTSDVLSSGGASVGESSNKMPAVALGVAKKDEFYRVTSKLSKTEDKLIVIWLDFEEGVDSYKKEGQKCGTTGSRCLSAATVSQGFSSDVIIQGNFTQDEVKTLVTLINSGSLPTKLEEVSSKTVTASFGDNSLSKTLVAGVVGILLVMALMIVLYHFSGFIASIGLLIYTVLTLGIFWLVGGVLTLPGIAAILLGIGMAVDANVLNFEKIKDELRHGSSLKTAFKRGNSSSIVTIVDANLTTLLVAIILFIFGESSIKGFATMLIISIFVTMLVMVVITRIMLKVFINTNYFDDKEKLFVGKYERKERNFNFVKNGSKFILITLVLVGIGVISLCTNKLNLGIDFKGGTLITFSEEISDDKIKEELKDYKIIDIDKDTNISVRIEDTLEKSEILKLQNEFETKYNVSTDINVVSNVVKKELVKNAIYSVIIAIIGIIIYISLRFTFNFGISSIVALAHDVFMIIAVFSVLKLEVSSIFIAAILSIIGYSINDTIVMFDRIRELLKNRHIKKQEELEDIVNLSIKDIVKRSIVTSITTMIPVISLIILGSKQILNFNIALLVGLIAGTYSSLFIAAYLWFNLEKKNIGKPKNKKWYEEPTLEEKKVKGINS